MTFVYSQSDLTAFMAVSVVACCVAAAALYAILYGMEQTRSIQQFREFSDQDLELEIAGGINKNTDTNMYASVQDDTAQDKKKPIWNVSSTRRFALLVVTLFVVTLTYLLLVVSNGPLWLRWTGLALTFAVTLGSFVLEDVRRGRSDRAVLLLAIILVLAATLNLATFAALQISNEDLYQGPARIVGYDTNKYNQNATDVTRTDLQVAFGGAWACPHHDAECRADVQGALCQRDTNATSSSNSYDQSTMKTNTTNEVYYDAGGNIVSNHTEKDVVYDKHGKVVDAYTSKSKHDYYGATGTTKDTVNQDDATTYDGSVVQSKASTNDTATYDKNGNVKAEGYTETVNEYKNGTIADEVQSEQDVNYTDNGTIDSMQIADETTNFDTNGTKKHVDYVDENLKYNGKGTAQDTNIVTEQVDYNGNGTLKNIHYGQDDTKNNGGKTTNEKFDETAKYNGKGQLSSYNYTDQETDTAANGTVLKRTKISDSGNGTRRLVVSQPVSSNETNAALKQENQELEKENQDLEKELDALKTNQEQLQDEIDQGGYKYDDDYVQDTYWNQMDWSSVWGDYECFNLFNSNLDGTSYNPDVAPGADGWPFLNVYGDCRTCQAYIVDYFSTEHFQSVQSREQAARGYAFASFLVFVLSALLYVKRRLAGKSDNEIDLLASGHAGAFA
jgi:hypothetical protein